MRTRVLAAVGGASLVLLGLAAPSLAAGEQQTYLVLYRQSAVPADAATAVARAGGSVVAQWGAIGVVTARSAQPAFAATLRRDSRVQGVSATGAFATRAGGVETAGDAATVTAGTPTAGEDPLGPLQWDMRQINAFAAHAVNGGSPAVVVGDIDTGLDKDHPDLQPNIDFTRSVSCESGAPNTDPAAWDDHNGHGTHTAGTIAAAANGIGITGVAPNVRVAGIKASNDDGYFFPEMVVCAFMWAGSHGIAVTNNSYFADPWRLNCRNDATQRAIWQAEQRAIRYAMDNGVTVVASAGNENEDMDHVTTDSDSPDYPPGSETTRDVTNACVKVPVEIPGVVGVSAVGNDRDAGNGTYLKSFYSSYAQSSVDVTAPGGDSVYGRTAEAVNGRVLSTYPAERPCTRRAVDPAAPAAAAYCYLQGTSMASPHVAGVAALLVSAYGPLRPGQVAALLQSTATPQACPTEDPFRAGTIDEAYCSGGSGHTSFYGAGQVDALAVVTR